MIQNQINTLTQLLKQKGIKNVEQREEMLDHYLSSYENRISSGKNPDKAWQLTISEIKNQNFTSWQNEISKTRYSPWIIAITTMCILSISYLYYGKNKEEILPSVSIADELVSQPCEEAESMLFPIQNMNRDEIVSHFGWRLHPLFKAKRMHTGIDIKAGNGTPVISPLSGRIKECGNDKLNGLYIIIDHGNGTSTKYSHLSKILLSEKYEVTQGETIGQVGSTGVSTAPHLHFELWKEGQPVDPMPSLVP